MQHLYLQRRDPLQSNLAQVHLFAAEMLLELAGKMFHVEHGQIGENVLTAGIDLLSLPLGSRLKLGLEAVVEITGLRTPCVKLDRFMPGLQALVWGPRDSSGKRTCRAGVMGVVRSGGDVVPGAEISIELPPLPHVPLRPV